MSQCYKCQRDLVKVNVVQHKLNDGFVRYCVFCYNEDFNANIPTTYSEEEGDAYLCWNCELEGIRVEMDTMEEATQHYVEKHKR